MSAARWLMVALLALASGAGGSDEDVANERIPVSKRALEQHWQIDCEALVARYNGAVAERFRTIGTEALSELVREATLCSFVHNVRVEGVPLTSCPDYTALGAILQAVRALRGAGDDGAQRYPDPPPEPIRCE